MRSTMRSSILRPPLLALRSLLVACVFAAGFAILLGPSPARADEYLDNVESFKWVIAGQGTTLGPPDGHYLQVGYVPDDDPYPLPSSITLAFQDNVAYDGPGADLRVHVVNEAPQGLVHIAVSYDGIDYVSAGLFTDDRGNIDLDLASLGLNAATHLRFTNASGPFGPYGFNLDAVEAIHSFEVPAISLTLDPPSNGSPGFEEHTVLTTVSDGDAVDGIRVSFAIVDGPNTGLATITTTYANGVTQFAWAGDGTEGTDTLEAWLDLDGNGLRDEGEPYGTATKQWRNAFTGTISITDLGGGTIEVSVTDLDLDTSALPDTVEVPVISTGDPVGMTLALVETDLHSGIFNGVLTIGAGEDAAGSTQSTGASTTLIAVEGDEVTATYDDAIDANNDDPPPVTASLIVGTAEGEHVTVCHIPPGNPDNQRTITIGASAAAAHLAHGDIEGECTAAEFPPKGYGSPHGPPSEHPGGGPPEGKGKPPK